MKLDYLDTIAQQQRCNAELGVWNGRGDDTPYFRICKVQLHFSGFTSVFTRDEGYHTSGWWKNPDYERCRHLSLSFFDHQTMQPRPRDREMTNYYLKAIFGNDRRWLWCEPPYTEQGKRQDVWHYRLFCDEAWQPIKPRGEVYSRELTEAGWLSFSDVREQERIRAKRLAEARGNR